MARVFCEPSKMYIHPKKCCYHAGTEEEGVKERQSFDCFVGAPGYQRLIRFTEQFGDIVKIIEVTYEFFYFSEHVLYRAFFFCTYFCVISVITEDFVNWNKGGSEIDDIFFEILYFRNLIIIWYISED